MVEGLETLGYIVVLIVKVRVKYVMQVGCFLELIFYIYLK